MFELKRDRVDLKLERIGEDDEKEGELDVQAMIRTLLLKSIRVTVNHTVEQIKAADLDLLNLEDLEVEDTAPGKLFKQNIEEKIDEIKQLIQSSTEELMKATYDKVGGKFLACLVMARLFVEQGDFSSFNKYLVKAGELPHPNEEPLLHAYIATEYSRLLEFSANLNDLQLSLGILEEILRSPHIPAPLLLESIPRMFSLVFTLGKEAEYFGTMVKLVEKKIKPIIGAYHIHLGYLYFLLGVAGLNSGNNQAAVNCLENSERIRTSTKTSSALSIAYAIVGRMDDAIAHQEYAVECIKGQPEANNTLDEAIGLLDKLKSAIQ